MKKLLTIFAGVVLATAMASAQAAGPTGGGVQGGKQQQGQQGQRDRKAHGPIAGKLLKELNLTPDQQKQVKDLLEKFKAKREEAAKTGGKQNRKAAMEMRKELMDNLAKILTPAQNAKLKELQDKAKDKVKDGIKNRNKNKNGGGAGTTGGGTTGGTKTGGGGGL